MQRRPEYTTIMAANGIVPMQEVRPPVKELLAIITREDLSADGLRQALREWSVKHLDGLKLVFVNELEATAKQYADRGLIPRDQPYLDNGNGVVSPALWNAMVKDGLFPVIDPHDLLAHLPSFLEPELRHRLVQKARLNNRLVAEQAQSPGATARDSSDYRRAVDAVGTLLLYRTRDETWENLNFLVHDQAGYHLIPQGNHAMLLPSPLMSLAQRPTQPIRSAVAKILGKGDADLKGAARAMADLLYPPAFDRSTPRTLPRFDEYSASNPTRLQEFNRSENVIGVGPRANAVNRARLELIIIEVAKRPELQKLRGEPKYISTFMDALATEMAKDRDLEQSFNLTNRTAYLGASLDLYEDYLDWIQRQRPGSNGGYRPPPFSF